MNGKDLSISRILLSNEFQSDGSAEIGAPIGSRESPIGSSYPVGGHQEPISKTSRFWMFSYKRDRYWLSAIKEIVLLSRGLSSGENIRDIRGV